MLEPRNPGTLSAWLDLQAGHLRRPRCPRASTRPTRCWQPARPRPAPDHALECENGGTACAGRQPALTAERAEDVVQHHVRPTGLGPRRPGTARAGAEVRLRLGTAATRSATWRASFPTSSTSPRWRSARSASTTSRATPLQIAMVSAGIANGGEVMKPYLSAWSAVPISRDRDHPARGVLPGRLGGGGLPADADDGQWSTDGTGTRRRSPASASPARPGPRSSAEGPPYAWFTSFAPADNPQVAVAVLIEKARTSRSRDDLRRHGSRRPMAKAIMEAVIGKSRSRTDTTQEKARQSAAGRGSSAAGMSWARCWVAAAWPTSAAATTRG